MTEPARRGAGPYRIAARIAAALTAFVGALAITGWFTGYRALAGVLDKYVPMAPNTAAAFLLLAGALWIRTLLNPGRALRIAQRAIPALVVAVAALTLADSLVGLDVDVDALLIRAEGAVGSFPLGLMSPITAVGFLLVAPPLVVPPATSRRVLTGASILASLAGTLGFAVTLGYLYGAPLLARSKTIPLALTTGTAFLMLSVGVLAILGPSVPPLRALAGPSVRARLLRTFVPVAIGTAALQAVVTNLTLSYAADSLAVFGAVTAFLVMVLAAAIVTEVSQAIASRIERAEAGERASSERLAALLEQLPVFVVVHRDGVIVFANPALARGLGHPGPEALAGKRLLDLVHPDDRDYVAQRLSSTLPLGAVSPVREQRWVTRGKEVITVEVAAKPISFDGAAAVLTVAHDVSQRRHLEDQLRQAVKMDAVGKLAGGVAHDFNNLLTAILSFSQFVSQDLGPEHPSWQDVEEVINSAQRAASLTRQLLALSRRDVIEPQDLNLNDVVSGMEKMLKRLIGEDVDLVAALDPSLGAVRGDRSHLEQILLNLVVNARDAMPHGGKLTIETANVELDDAYVQGHLGAQAGSYVLLAVTDTGVGMDEEVRAHVFEPFFTTKGQGKGTGLGLSTVQGIVKQLGGDILVYSAKGRGTTFKIYLPRLTELERAEPPPPSTAVGHETVLLAEDDDAVRAVTVRTLRARGYTVLECSSAEQAVQVWRARGASVDLLITDVVMPALNGRDLVELLRQQRPSLRILFMSGYTGGALVHQGIFESGAAYLQKPFTPDLLAEKVRQVLDGTAPAGPGGIGPTVLEERDGQAQREGAGRR
jgi:two-component system, cell cycle sensor histidine kinase and response regulator CckA